MPTARSVVLAIVVALATALACAPRTSDAQVNVLPRQLEEVGVTEHLLAQVPTDAVLRDHTGARVSLASVLHAHRPVVLNLVYYRCPMLCNLVLNALVNGLRGVGWTVGDQYEVVTISIDPRETPDDASAKRDRVLGQYDRAPAQTGWHFLVGDDATVHRIANSVGFRYRYDAQQGQYAHGAAVMLLTPEGRVARYLYGLEFKPNDLRLGLLEASEGRSMTTVDRIVLYCYHYDPHQGSYVVVAMRVMQLGGVLTMVLLGGLLGTLWYRDRARRASDMLTPDLHVGLHEHEHVRPDDVDHAPTDRSGHENP